MRASLGQFGLARRAAASGARLYIEFNLVAIANEGERSADGRFRRDVQDDRAIRRAAHAGVGDADHIADALFQQLLRDGQVADLGHARSANGAGVLQHEHVVGRDVERGVVDARFDIGRVFEDERGTAMLAERGRGGGVFDDRAIGGEVAAQDAQAAFGRQRVVD